MKKIFIVVLFLFSNLFALNIGGQEILIGMSIDILDTNCFDVRLDSIGTTDITRSYKYIATSKIQLNIANGFHRVTIEAMPISGIVYNITLLNQIIYGYKRDGSEVDSMKKFFNENIKIMEHVYGKFNYSTDDSLPYLNFKKVCTNSMLFKYYDDITIYLSISDIGELLTVQSLFIDIDLKKYGEKESMILNERKVIKKLNKIIDFKTKI